MSKVLNRPVNTSYRRISKLVRSYLHLTGTPYPIVWEDGFSPPRQEGEPAYHTTPSGKTIVRHPNAYGYRTLYHPSTIHLCVGAGWVLQQLMEADLRTAAPHLLLTTPIGIVQDYLVENQLRPA